MIRRFWRFFREAALLQRWLCLLNDVPTGEAFLIKGLKRHKLLLAKALLSI